VHALGLIPLIHKYLNVGVVVGTRIASTPAGVAQGEIESEKQ
jgi:hypothetical protein